MMNIKPAKEFNALGFIVKSGDLKKEVSAIDESIESICKMQDEKIVTSILNGIPAGRPPHGSQGIIQYTEYKTKNE